MSDSLMSMIQNENAIIDLAKQLVTSMVETSAEMYEDDPDWGIPTKEMISNRSIDYATDVLNDFRQSVLEEMQLYLANITVQVKVTQHLTITVIDN